MGKVMREDGMGQTQLVADLSYSSLSEASSAEFRVMRTLVMVPWVPQGCPPQSL